MGITFNERANTLVKKGVKQLFIGPKRALSPPKKINKKQRSKVDDAKTHKKME